MKNKKEFDNLIKDYHPIIFKICRVYSAKDDFEDLYQEVLISLWRSLGTYAGRSKLSTWLYRVVLNTALTYQRNTKKHKSQVAIEPTYVIADTRDNANEKEQQIELLYTAISKLKKDDRSLVLLYLEEKSYEEITEITGLTMSNVGVKISRLKKKLFELINELKNERAGTICGLERN